MGFLRRRARRRENALSAAPESGPDLESGAEDAASHTEAPYTGDYGAVVGAAYDATYNDGAYEGAYAGDEITPFVPVEADYDAASGEAEESGARRRRLHRPHLRLPRPSVRLGVRGGPLGAALALIALGVFGTLLNLGDLSGDVETWWPVVVIGVALVWMLVALIRRQVAAFLGGSALAGVGVSLLLSTQDIASFRDTLLGLGLVAIGLGIVIRGFLLRQQTPL